MMSAAVAAALKKIAVSLLTNPKVLKTVLGIVLGMIIIIIMPIVAVVSIFNGSIEIDTDRLQTMVVENLSAEEQQKLQFVEDTMYAIEDEMKVAGFGGRVKEAQVLYTLVLSDKAHEPDFISNLVGCFSAEQTDAQLIAAINAAFGTELTVEDFTKVMHGIKEKLVEVARSQLGNVGGEPYWSWYGFEARVEWCACFVSWCANECGYIDREVIPKFSSCAWGVEWFKERGQWQDGGYEPRPGDIIFFDWDSRGSSGPQDGESDHVGIVERVESGMVYTIEGNSGDECRARSYPVGHYEILGYGIPMQQTLQEENQNA